MTAAIFFRVRGHSTLVGWPLSCIHTQYLWWCGVRSFLGLFFTPPLFVFIAIVRAGAGIDVDLTPSLPPMKTSDSTLRRYRGSRTVEQIPSCCSMSRGPRGTLEANRRTIVKPACDAGSVATVGSDMREGLIRCQKDWVSRRRQNPQRAGASRCPCRVRIRRLRTGWSAARP